MENLQKCHFCISITRAFWEKWSHVTPLLCWCKSDSFVYFPWTDCIVRRFAHFQGPIWSFTKDMEGNLSETDPGCVFVFWTPFLSTLGHPFRNNISVLGNTFRKKSQPYRRRWSALRRDPKNRFANQFCDLDVRILSGRGGAVLLLWPGNKV